jgi:hypothetical protein
LILALLFWLNRPVPVSAQNGAITPAQLQQWRFHCSARRWGWLIPAPRFYAATQSGGASGFTASGSGNISDTVTMPPASTITYKATGMISASATGSISNTATVTAPAGVLDPNTANNSATATDTL